jgi:hypothetical protein
MILTKMIKNNEWLGINYLLWIDYFFNKIFYDSTSKKGNV